MSSLISTMWIALGALQAQQAGLQTTANNVANLNTKGYSRERPILEEANPIVEDRVAFGGGVQLKGIESLRSSLLDLQISDETQQRGKFSGLRECDEPGANAFSRRHQRHRETDQRLLSEPQ